MSANTRPTKKLAVAVIHGVGDQTRPDLDQPSYSAPLWSRVARKLGAQAGEIAWAEVYWADIYQDRETRFLEAFDAHAGRGVFPWTGLRRFVIDNLADASAYIYSSLRGHSGEHTAYRQTHDRIQATLARLEMQVEPGSPLILVAHSMGAQIATDYIYDVSTENSSNARDGTPFERCSTLINLVTFGCNIPIFALSLEQSDRMHRIKNPGPQNPANPAWWHNFYDRSDVFGFPVAPIGKAYDSLIAQGEVVDHRIITNPWIRSWATWWAHNDYWRTRAIVNHLVNTIQAVIE